MSQNNAAVARQKPKFTIAITTDKYQQLIRNTLGDPERAKRFIASISSAVAVNPALQDCDAGTILAGALLGESLNLQPSPQLGQYYLVPFDCRLKGPDGKALWALDENGQHIKDKKGRWIAVTEKRAQFVLGYKGYIQLALRSGAYLDIDVLEVKEGEYLGKDPATGKPRFRFVEDDDERDLLPVIGYMAYFEYLNGFRKVIYWTKRKMMSHADMYSPAFSAAAYEKLQNGEIPQDDLWKYSSFWYKNFDDMAKKTLLRQLISKWGVMSTEMAMAFERDTSMMSFGQNGDLLPEPEPDPVEPEDMAQGNYELTTPEADAIEEKVDLNDL